MPQIQVWINNDDPANVEKIVKTLNDAVVANKANKLKAFVIFLSDDRKAMEAKLSAIADKAKSHEICLAYISPKNEAVGAYKVKVDPSVKNTFMFYRYKRVTAKQVNLVADDKGLGEIKSGVASTFK